jgi:hypothetical protein
MTSETNIRPILPSSTDLMSVCASSGYIISLRMLSPKSNTIGYLHRGRLMRAKHAGARMLLKRLAQRLRKLNPHKGHPPEAASTEPHGGAAEASAQRDEVRRAHRIATPNFGLRL